jgi:hypothetical protein
MTYRNLKKGIFFHHCYRLDQTQRRFESHKRDGNFVGQYFAGSHLKLLQSRSCQQVHSVVKATGHLPIQHNYPTTGIQSISLLFQSISLK